MQRTGIWIVVGALLVISIGVCTPGEASAHWITSIIEAITRSSKSVPKHAPEITPPKHAPEPHPGPAPKASEGVTAPPIAEPRPGVLPHMAPGLARAVHQRSCPTNSLRVSLPQLNAIATVPPQVNLRAEPTTGSRVLMTLREGANELDVLEEHSCWLKVRIGRSKTVGWISAKLLLFEFDDHMAMPRTSLRMRLTPEELYKAHAYSTYLITKGRYQGSAVAICTAPGYLDTR